MLSVMQLDQFIARLKKRRLAIIRLEASYRTHASAFEANLSPSLNTATRELRSRQRFARREGESGRYRN